MNDEKKQEQPEQTSSTNPLLDAVKAERMALEKAREEAKIEADRLEHLRSDQLLSGTAGISQQQQEIPEAEKKKQASAEFFKGTQIEAAIKKHG